MAEYTIDYNRGSDSNDGITAPWKNLSKAATQVLASGDSLLLAADSEWEISAHINVAAGWGGTKSSPARIGRYFPAGVNTGKPRISRRRAIAANEWTYDGANNGWYITWFGVDVGVGSYITLGGTWGKCQEAALPLASINGGWKNGATGRVYVYAPSGVNPTDYYGAVDFAAGSRATFSFSNTGNHVVVEDIAANDGGGLVWCYSTTGARQFTVQRCTFDRTGVAVDQFSETAGSLALAVLNNEFRSGVAMYVKSYAVSGLGFGGLLVEGNRFTGGGAGFSNGNVYMQSRGSGVSIVRGNTFDAAPYGSGFTTLDGSAVYAEVGSDNVFVIGNTVRDCHLAFTDNSGRSTTWMGNLIVDCFSAMKCDDFSSVGATDHRYYNNTQVNAGAPISAAGPNSMYGIGWWSYLNKTAYLKNNIFTKHPSAAGAAIEIGTGATGEIAHNCHSGGFAGLVETYLGGASPITPTNTVASNPLLDASYRPMAGSPCLAAGTRVSGVRLRDFYGKEIDDVPDIGAVQVYPLRSPAATRVQASTRTQTTRTIASKRAA